MIHQVDFGVRSFQTNPCENLCEKPGRICFFVSGQLTYIKTSRRHHSNELYILGELPYPNMALFRILTGNCGINPMASNN